MKEGIKKLLLLLILAIISVSFSGCINLSSKPKTETGSAMNADQGVFKSFDGGKAWEHKVKVAGAEEKDFLDKMKIASMKMDPRDNQVLYLGTISNGLYKSKDGAETWEKVADENNILSGTATVYNIAIEKSNPDIIYLAALNGGRGEVLKSEDGGKSWTESYIIAEPNKPVNFVSIDSQNSNIVYIGTEQGGLIKSEDRGKKWHALNWFKTAVKDFVVDFHNNKGIIVRTSSEIFKSKDGGNEWESLNKTMANSLKIKVAVPQISSMAMDNNNPLVIYITYLNLILVTNDGGYAWYKLDTITPSLTALGTIPQIKQIGMVGNIIYYGAGNVIYKSENKGINWSSYNIPIKGDVRYTVSDYMDSSIILSLIHI